MVSYCRVKTHISIHSRKNSNVYHKILKKFKPPKGKEIIDFTKFMKKKTNRCTKTKVDRGSCNGKKL